MVVRSLGFRPIIIYLRSARWLSVVETLMPVDCYVTLRCEDSLPSAARGSVAFADCPLRPKELALCEAAHLQWLLSPHPPGPHLRHWASDSTSVSHAVAGGVTARTVTFYRWRPRSSSPVAPRRQRHCIPRDASTIVSTSAFGQGSRKAPTGRTLFPLQALNLGSSRSPLWHSGGLLPDTLHPRLKVLTPCLGLPPQLWGIRRLQPRELLFALDCSDEVVSGLLAAGQPFTTSFWSNFLPGKCLSAAFETLCAPRRPVFFSRGGYFYYHLYLSFGGYFYLSFG